MLRKKKKISFLDMIIATINSQTTLQQETSSVQNSKCPFSLSLTEPLMHVLSLISSTLDLTFMFLLHLLISFQDKEK